MSSRFEFDDKRFLVILIACAEVMHDPQSEFSDSKTKAGQHRQFHNSVHKIKETLDKIFRGGNVRAKVESRAFHDQLNVSAVASVIALTQKLPLYSIHLK